MAKLPQILAGPILRRCTETMVTVWLATSIDFTDGLELDLYDAWNVKAPVRIDVTTDHQVVKAGANLFVHLLVARPKGTSGAKPKPFPRGRLLGYEVKVLNRSVPEDSVLHSQSLSIWLPTEKLSYGVYSWPTFFLQADRNALRVIHGSCRRAYAKGPDSMAAADTLINQSQTDVTQRPTLMILTGDQIYADDILYSMWAHTSNMAQRLMAYDETVPVDGKPRRLSAITARKDLVLKNGLTTDDGENHLIGFSEYAAHYLINWSETLWADYKIVRGPNSKDNPDQWFEVERFQRTLPAVRRALANVPTYMIFDDHDVTDDWNIDRQFFAETEASELGRRLITSALYAYWLFQGWGNDPDAFDAKFVARIQAFCDLFAQTAGSPTAAETEDYDDFIRNDIGVSSSSPTQPSWSYVVPCTPPIFVVDSRTSRDLQPRGTAPGLIDRVGQQALADTITNTPNFDRSRMPLVMVATTPVWPVQWISELQQQQVAKDGPLKWDLELWRNNLKAHTDFLRAITDRLNPTALVFLSGDVHYGYTSHTVIYTGTLDPDKKLPGRKYVDIYQLTSSAFKNESEMLGKAGHWYSKKLSGPALGGIVIENSWVNYLFAGMADVTQVGYRLIDRALTITPNGVPVYPDVAYLNLAGLPSGPMLVPDSFFGPPVDAKANQPPRWREEVKLHDHRNSSGAYLTADSHLGVVTFNGLNLTHDLYGVEGSDRPEDMSPLAPKTWGPGRVSLRL